MQISEIYNLLTKDRRICGFLSRVNKEPIVFSRTGDGA